MNGIQLTIAGNLTRDPEVTTSANGNSRAKFTVATERTWKNEQTGEWDKATAFIEVVAWRYVAEDVERLLEKGVRVIVTGRLDQHSWEDKDTGAKRSKLELTADEVAIATKSVESFDRRSFGGNGQQAPARPAASRPAPARAATSGDDIWG